MITRNIIPVNHVPSLPKPNDTLLVRHAEYVNAPPTAKEQRRRQRIAILYTVFGDESHDEGNQRVFAVAGLFGSQEDWDDLERTWVARTGGKVFHAAGCEADRGDFAGIDHGENLKLYADLTKILANSRLLGFGAAFDLVGYKQFFSDVLDDMPYYRCFREVVQYFAEKGYLSIPPAKVKFTFDQRLESNYNAAALYNYVATLPEWKYHSQLFEEIGFATRNLVGIQAADLYAREVMKHLDNIVGPIQRPRRKSMTTLRQTNRFGCDIYTREYFEDFRKKFDALSAATGMNREEYANWLAKYKLTDNFSVRLRYLIEFDKRERGTA